MRRSLDQFEVGLDLSQVSFGAAVLEEDQGAGSGVGDLAAPEDIGDEVGVVLDEDSG